MEGKPSFVRIRTNCFKAEQPSQLLLSGIVDSTELPRTFAGKEENTNNFPARLGIGGFHAVSGDTNNNGEMNKCWWTNKTS